MIIVVVVCAAVVSRSYPSTFFITANKIGWFLRLIGPRTCIPVITRPGLDPFLIDRVKCTIFPLAELFTVPVQATVCTTITPVYTIVTRDSWFLFIKLKCFRLFPGAWACTKFWMSPIFFFGLVAFKVASIVNNPNHDKVTTLTVCATTVVVNVFAVVHYTAN